MRSQLTRKSRWAIVAACALVAAACGGSDSSDDAIDADSALAEVIEDLADEIDELNQQIDDLERENAESESSDGSDSGSDADQSSGDDSNSDGSSTSGSSSGGSSDGDSSSGDGGSSSSSDGDSSGSSSSDVTASYIPEPMIDERGTVADKDVAEEIAEELGCEGSHEMDGRHMPCSSHGEGEPLMEELAEEMAMAYPEDGMYDTMEEAERAAEMAACEGSHEMDGMYMPCDGHDEYVDNMEMIESVETVEITEDGMYDTEAEALAAAAEMGCTGTHQMGDEYMMCGEHSEGEEAVLAIERIVEAPPVDDADGVLEVVIDDPAQMEITVKDGRDIMVDAYYDGRPLNSIDGDVCIVLYNQYSNPTGCREGTTFTWSPQSWKVRCQTPINGSPKKFYSILMRDRSGTELARIEVSEDSPFAC